MLVLISESKDEDEENDSKEMAAFPGYDMLSERERKVGMMHVLTAFPGYNMLSERERQVCILYIYLPIPPMKFCNINFHNEDMFYIPWDSSKDILL